MLWFKPGFKLTRVNQRGLWLSNLLSTDHGWKFSVAATQSPLLLSPLLRGHVLSIDRNAINNSPWFCGCDCDICVNMFQQISSNYILTQLNIFEHQMYWDCVQSTECVKKASLKSCWCMMTSSNGNFSALLALCVGNSPVTGEFPTQGPVTRNLGVFFDPRLNKRLS